MKPEAVIQSEILASTVGNPHIRLWRANVVAAAVSLSAVERAMLACGFSKRDFNRVAARLQPRDTGLPGQADLIGILDTGQFVGIEVKAPKGRMSEAQTRFRAMVQKFNGCHIVARSVDDVAWLASTGVPAP